jgi:hypothetical protein
MPKGRHIHSAKFRRCVREVSESRYDGRKYNPYAVCSASIKYKENILKGHRKSGKIRGMPRAAIEKMLKNPRTPAHLKAYWTKQLKKVV